MEVKDYREYKVNLIRKGVHETDVNRISLFDISVTPLPAIFSLRNKIPFIYDQGKIGACVPNATSLYLAYLNNNFISSRLFIYYNGRVISGVDISQDTGLGIIEGCISVKENPPCAETLWEYKISNIFTKPSKPAYSTPYTLINYNYYTVSQDLQSIKKCIFEGFPIMLGINLYSNFYKVSKNGVINMPSAIDKFEGGHAVLVVGYNDKTERFTCVNTWGEKWGDNGFFTLPYKYITDTKYAYDLYSMSITNTDINEHKLQTNMVKKICNKCILS